MNLMKFLRVFAVTSGVAILVGAPGKAQEAPEPASMPNAAGAAAFSIGPDGTVYGAAVAASVSEDTAFAESRNAAGVSAARAFGSSQIQLDPFGPWAAPTDENFNVDDVGGGLGIVSININQGNVTVATQPIITQEQVDNAFNEGFEEGFDEGFEEGQTTELVNQINNGISSLGEDVANLQNDVTEIQSGIQQIQTDIDELQNPVIPPVVE